MTSVGISFSFIHMRHSLFLLLLFTFSFTVQAQLDFDEHSEKLAVFGLTLMPNNETFITLEADYDGMFIRERELYDFFEKLNIRYSDDLTNWEYYDYWILDNRGGKQNVPNEKVLYNMVVDPTGNLLAVYLDAKDEYNTKVRLFDLGAQNEIAVFDIFDFDENAEHINLLKFDKPGKKLIIGTEANGTFSYDIKEAKLSKLEIPDNLQLIAVNYTDNTMTFAPFTIDDYGTISYGEGYMVYTNGNLEATSDFSPTIDFTTMFTPLEMNKMFTEHYRQDYDTYITLKGGNQQMILYRNLVTFEIISTEQTIDIATD